MINRTILIILTFLTLSGCSGTPEQTKSLHCLNEQQSKFVNSIITKLDEQLKEKYGKLDYKTLLNEISSRALPPDFFVKSDLAEFLNESRSESTFKDIWIQGDGMFQLNTSGDYFKCLKSECADETFCEVLSTMEQVAGISPGLISGALASELSNEQYNSNAVRTFIAINLCSELSINLYDRFNK